MANRSYLCVTNVDTTYPSFVEKTFDSATQTIACDVWCVPLLWMGLFRPHDIVCRTLAVDDEEFVTEAPIVARTLAIQQLDDAVSYFNALYSTEGRLDEYAAFLKQALASASMDYVTVELQEIACLADSEQEFYDNFRAALTAIGTDQSEEAKERFADITQFRDLVKFPPARLLLDESTGFEASDDDFWNHCRVCGAGQFQSGMGRTVPWEPQPSSAD